MEGVDRGSYILETTKNKNKNDVGQADVVSSSKVE
jgi:hypothetical protein